MLTTDERIKLTDLIANLYDFTDGGPRGRRVLIQQSSLNRFIPGMDLAGSNRTVAGALLSVIEDFGPLPEEPTKHALGSLLNYIRSLGDVKEADKSFMAGLIVKYSLVADPLFIDQLRKDYGIEETVVRTPPPANVAPPVASPSDVEPEFEVEVKAESDLEAIVNSEDNFLDVSWLFGAIYTAQAVCRIEVPEDDALGTGFLIGPDLLLTNHHVLKNEDYVKQATVRFDYRTDSLGVVSDRGRVFTLEPDFYKWSPPGKLDYALVRVKGTPLKQEDVDPSASVMDLVLKGKHRGYLVIRPDYVKQYERVNIIQHPDGRPMKAVLTQNYVVDDIANSRLHYVADTMKGSSGSPVLNRKWEVVGLHHSGKPYPPEAAPAESKKKRTTRVNEGIPMRDIIEDFKKNDLERYLPRD